MSEITNQRGGSRPGAGRPRCEHEKKTVSYRLPIHVINAVNILSRQKKIDKSEFVTRAIIHYTNCINSLVLHMK